MRRHVHVEKIAEHKMIHPTTASAELLRPAAAAESSSSNNEAWDDVVLPGAGTTTKADGALFPTTKRLEPMHHHHHQTVPTFRPTAATETSSPLDDFLSGDDGHNRYPFGFTLSIPTTQHHSAEDDSGSCSGESTVSDVTLMTYRAELMKQVSFIIS